MCERRIRKIKRGSELSRMREARRLQRPRNISQVTTVNEDLRQSFVQPTIDKTAQHRLILELAWRTVALVYKNRLIQQKIIALQKETNEFVRAVMSNPENKKRYLEHMRLYGTQSVKIGQGPAPVKIA